MTPAGRPAPAVVAPVAGGHRPRHVAIIMDGNGRWAEARRLPRIAGHRAGAEAVRRTVRAAGEMGLEALTVRRTASAPAR